MSGLFDPRERMSPERKIERLEERVGLLEARLVVCAETLEFGLMFFRSAFQAEDPVTVAAEWFEEIENKFAGALSEARRRY